MKPDETPLMLGFVSALCSHLGLVGPFAARGVPW